MIGMAGEDRQGPIDLFGCHDARQLVWPGHGAERNHKIRLGTEFGIESIRAADDKTDRRHAPIAAAAEIGGKFSARKISARRIASNATRPGANNRADRFGFFELAVVWTTRPALVDLALLDMYAKSSPRCGGAIEIALDQIPLWAGFGSSDRNEKETHRSAGVTFAGPISAPHLLEIVELAHLGTEQMHEHIAGIDQNPVAMRQPLDAWRFQAGVFDRLDHVLGDRSDMYAGASGGYDHGIGDRGLAMQVEANDVFCFGIFETRQNGLREKTGVRLSRTLHRGKR
jgi:hypothetical protein